MKKVVVISGGAGGIGFVVAKTFQANDYQVIILDLDSPRLKEISEKEGMKTYACNLVDTSSLDKVVDQIVSEYGKIDSLIQVAGLMRSASAFDISANDWDLMFNINTRGTFFLAKSVVEKAMKNTGGTIVNFSSAAAIRGFMGSMASTHYGASKAAVIALTQQLACEWGQYGVRVNAVVPGGVLTEAMKKLQFDPTMLENIPLRKLSEPQNIADVVFFLASEKSCMITGQALVVDGGASIVGQ